MTDPLREAAAALIHLWQNDALTALISLEAWPELGEAIDELGEALVPARARLHRDAAIRFDDLQPGDIIQFDYPPDNLLAHYNGVEWQVDESRPDDTRPGQGYWRVSGHRRIDDVTTEVFSQDEHGSFQVIWKGTAS